MAGPELPLRDNEQGSSPINEDANAILADLRKKLISVRTEESDTIRRHALELNSILSRRDLILSTIKGIETFYSTESKNRYTNTDNNNPVAVPDGNDAAPEPTENPVELPRSRPFGLLRNAVISTIARYDDFLSSEEVYERVHEDYPTENFEKKQVSTGLRDYRISRRVIPILAADKAGNKLFLHGLPFFFDMTDRRRPKVKAQYIDKLERKVAQLELAINRALYLPE